MSTHRLENYRITGLPVRADSNNPTIIAMISRLSARLMRGCLRSDARNGLIKARLIWAVDNRPPRKIRSGTFILF